MALSNLYGLKRNSKVNIIFDLRKQNIVSVTGCDMAHDVFEVSDELAFSTPIYISINGIPLFPSKYEAMSVGRIIYSSYIPPAINIKFANNNFLYQRAKIKQNTILLKDLQIYDVFGRKRNPNQNQIMGESARNHIEKYVKNGTLVIDNNSTNVDWHWCHLVSFKMLPTDKAQTSRNIVCGTSACNGHMTNIESAVKRFIYEYKRPLALSVTATIYQGTHIAERISYRVFDKRGSQLSYAEYFDAFTSLKSDTLDHFTIYSKMKEAFGEN